MSVEKAKKFILMSSFVIIGILLFFGIVFVAKNYVPDLSEKTEEEKYYGSTMYYYNYTEIETEGLEDYQKDLVQRLVFEDLRKSLHSRINYVYVTSNSSFCENQINLSNCYGYSHGPKIYIEWQEFEKRDNYIVNKYTLCHEVLHAYFLDTERSENLDPVHKALSKVAKGDTCYMSISYSGVELKNNSKIIFNENYGGKQYEL